MSGGFSFPPPPPPPPKPLVDHQQYGEQPRGRGRGRVRGRGGPRGNFEQRGRGYDGGRGTGSFNGHATGANRQESGQPNQHFQAQSPPNNSITGPSSGFGYQNAQPANNYGQRKPQAGSPQRTTTGHKRKLDALRGPQSERINKPAPQTAPAVPSFGGPILPPKPALPSPQLGAANPQDVSKPKPAGRGLGLLPTAGDVADDLSDSEDDKDVDEEAMYAELGDKLTFEHNGVVMSLKSQADLAAWKKERQKNWPTTSRMSVKEEERRRVGDERRRLLAGAQVLQRPSLGGKVKSRPRPLRTAGVAQDFGTQGQQDDTAVKTVDANHEPFEDKIGMRSLEMANGAGPQKTDRAKQLEDLRRKVAQSEAKNRLAKAQVDRSQHQLTMMQEAKASTEVEERLGGAVEMTEDDLEQDAIAGEDANLEPADNEEISHSQADPSASEASSDSSSASEPDSDDEPPEETASKPPELPTLGREPLVCRYFAASGHCLNGDACRFKHVQRPQRPAQPDRKEVTKPPPSNVQTERKTIFNRLMEQEQDGADRLALQVIKYLGKAGLFKAEDGHDAG
ncbi:hypothetical protein LTR09_008696 [Extremus antarcticus]|uniref:C3H1-type domain-containing protein n=1 Tax=Extremus antarcticus TaxID=702011 RepID=A0AAJ0DAD2_9PEZI|nr:hypothetical protein LTR09_008696 [Extremus antarcticus]